VPPELMEALTPLLINVAIGVVTTIIGVVGVAFRSFLNAKLNAEQLALFNEVATIGVQAAEQLYGAANGDAKKDFAIQFVEAELAKRGIKNVDVDRIASVIEAAVLAEFNFPAAVTPAEAPAETVVVAGPANEATD
jgi:LL-H family phage holin